LPDDVPKQEGNPQTDESLQADPRNELIRRFCPSRAHDYERLLVQAWEMRTNRYSVDILEVFA